MNATKDTDSQVWFFGVGHRCRAGHCLYSYEGGREAYGTEATAARIPERLHCPDQTLCPGKQTRSGGDQIQGHALIHVIDDWIAIGFWDRTGDSRFGCNSNFFVRGIIEFGSLVALAQKQYPLIFSRFTFPLVLVGPDVDPAATTTCLLPKCERRPRWRIETIIGSMIYGCDAHIGQLLPAVGGKVDPIVVPS